MWIEPVQPRAGPMRSSRPARSSVSRAAAGSRASSNVIPRASSSVSISSSSIATAVVSTIGDGGRVDEHRAAAAPAPRRRAAASRPGSTTRSRRRARSRSGRGRGPGWSRTRGGARRCGSGSPRPRSSRPRPRPSTEICGRYARRTSASSDAITATRMPGRTPSSVTPAKPTIASWASLWSIRQIWPEAAPVDEPDHGAMMIAARVACGRPSKSGVRKSIVATSSTATNRPERRVRTPAPEATALRERLASTGKPCRQPGRRRSRRRARRAPGSGRCGSRARAASERAAPIDSAIAISASAAAPPLEGPDLTEAERRDPEARAGRPGRRR